MAEAPGSDVLNRGNMATIYRHGDRQVRKVFEPRVFPGAAEAELAATRKAHDLGLLVPRAEGIVEVDGRPGVVYEKVEGRLLVDALTGNPARLWSDARALATLHREIHERLGDGLPELRAVVRAGVDRFDEALLPAPVKQAAREYLSALPEGHAFCHMDFHPGNVFLTKHGLVTFDWTLAARAHPAADVAHTVVAMGEGAPLPHMSAVQRLITDVFRKAFTRAYLRDYVRATQLDEGLVEAFKPLAWLLRLVLVGNPLERDLLACVVRGRFGGAAAA